MRLGKKEVINTILIMALISIMVYFIVRTVLLAYADYTEVDKTLSILLLVGEGFILIHGFGYVVNVIRAYRAQKEEQLMDMAAHTPLKEEPSVAVLVAARHEPKDVLEETFISLRNLKYKNKSIYFLDDSSEEKYKKEAEELARELDINLFKREKRHGAKAGIINDCLKTLEHEYVAIFDADQTPLPDFLNMVVSLMEKDEKLAFVQTPQFYTNIEESHVARGAAFQQAVFYEYICEGKSSRDAMFCCGTNIIFRKEALVHAGGLDESTITEDFATSLKLHTRGWKSLYYNHVYAFGMAPENLAEYFKQQFRWANGTISVLKKILWKLLRNPFSLRPSQWWEYLLSGSYYLIGLAFFMLMVFPVVYLLFKIPSFFAKPEIYFLAFLPYIILSISVFYMVLAERNYTRRDLFTGQLLGFIAFPTYMKAAISAILGRKTLFPITSKTKEASIPYFKLWPQILIISVSFIAVVWGINRFIYERTLAIMINSFWTFYHCLVLSSIFYFNEKGALK
jgi:cellulose synthase (UDP-forming)